MNIGQMRIGLAILSLWPAMALAQSYEGDGVEPGLEPAKDINVPHEDLRILATKIIASVLSYLALAAVTVIVIAGIYLIVGQGSDASKEKAKKITKYTLIGLLVVLFSRI